MRDYTTLLLETGRHHNMDAVISMSCLHQTRDMFYS